MECAHSLLRETQSEDHHIWKILLDEPLLSRTRSAVHCVAEHMCNPERMQQIAQLARKQSLISNVWDLSFPSAASELALFYWYVARCFSDTSNWQAAAQLYLKLMAAGSQQHGLASPSLVGGMSGIAVVVQHFSETGQHYQQTLAHLHHAIAEQVRKHSIWQNKCEASGPEFAFDLISGASGILGYLASVPEPDQIVLEAFHTLLDYLLALTVPRQIQGQEHWLCLPPHFLTERDRQYYPYGRFNCGLAHGIPGPLAALSLTALAGYDHHGLHDAIFSVSEWLLQHQLQDEWGITWPAAIPYELATSPEQWCTLPASRAAWCYGAPGIARSLWLAGCALKQKHLMDIALDAIKAVLRRPVAKRNIDSPTLCHGTAGLLLICLHFAQETQDAFLLEQIPLLVEQILAQFDQQSPLGFRDIEPGGILVDQPSLLTGAPGTALALLATASNIAPSWDRLLLLS